MSLGKEKVQMIMYLTGNKGMIDSFMEPEVVDRLATMLDYNLIALWWSKMSKIKL
jgi:ubiquitin conjugation factor E4 B